MEKSPHCVGCALCVNRCWQCCCCLVSWKPLLLLSVQLIVANATRPFIMRGGTCSMNWSIIKAFLGASYAYRLANGISKKKKTDLLLIWKANRVSQWLLKIGSESQCLTMKHKDACSGLSELGLRGAGEGIVLDWRPSPEVKFFFQEAAVNIKLPTSCLNFNQHCSRRCACSWTLPDRSRRVSTRHGQLWADSLCRDPARLKCAIRHCGSYIPIRPEPCCAGHHRTKLSERGKMGWVKGHCCELSSPRLCDVRCN